MVYTGSDSNDLYILANELAEANRLKRIEIFWGGRAGNINGSTAKKLIDVLQNPDDNNLDLDGDFDE